VKNKQVPKFAPDYHCQDKLTDLAAPYPVKTIKLAIIPTYDFMLKKSNRKSQYA